jgi:hypothetical protein
MGKKINPFYRIIANMQEQHQAHNAKLQSLLKMCSTTEDMRARSTLFKIYKNCRNLYTEMDKEMINCRRSGKVTPKYTDLEFKYIEAINTFDQWTVVAMLMF